MARRLTFAQQCEAVAFLGEMTEAEWLYLFFEWRGKLGQPMPNEDKFRALAKEAGT